MFDGKKNLTIIQGNNNQLLVQAEGGLIRVKDYILNSKLDGKVEESEKKSASTETRKLLGKFKND